MRLKKILFKILFKILWKIMDSNDRVFKPVRENILKNIVMNHTVMLTHSILSGLERSGKVTAENRETVARTILDELQKEEYAETIKKIQSDFLFKDKVNEAEITTLATLILDKINRQEFV